MESSKTCLWAVKGRSENALYSVYFVLLSNNKPEYYLLVVSNYNNNYK